MNRCVRYNAGCRDGWSYLWSASKCCACSLHFRSSNALPHEVGFEMLCLQHALQKQQCFAA